MDTEQITLLTVRNAAARLGVSPGTCYRLIEDEGLPAVELRGLKRIPARALEEWVRLQERRAVGSP